jgi:hypothetical protein
MSKTNRQTKTPTHEVFHVVGDGENARWTKVGIGWAHKDNSGINLVVNYAPLVDGRTVVRRIKTNEEG